MSLHIYTLAVLAFPVRIRASSLAQARRKLLKRYLNSATIRSPWLPATPTMILVHTTDERALNALFDSRLDPGPRPKQSPPPPVSIR